MNPYASDAIEHQEPLEQQTPGLSGSSILATILMLVFGLSGLTSILGIIVGLIQFTSNTPANQAIQPTPLQFGIQTGVGILDFLLAIPMVLWSVQVLQRKRAAAVKLSSIALLMALLEIPRGLISYIFLPQVLEGLKNGMIEGLEQQPNQQGQAQPADIDSIFQLMSYAMIGCTGAILILMFVAYLFCYFQLRKPTTLARLSG